MLGAGLEVISAPQLQQSPAVLSAPAGAATRPVDEGPTRKHRPLCALDLNPDLSRGACLCALRPSLQGLQARAATDG